MFTDILNNHPNSNRAKYALARTWDFLYQKANDTTEKQKYCDTAKDLVKDILAQDNLKENMKMASAHLLLSLSEQAECLSRPDQIRALEVIRTAEPGGRHAVVLCQELFFEGRYDEALDYIHKIHETNPEHFVLILIKVCFQYVSIYNNVCHNITCFN